MVLGTTATLHMQLPMIIPLYTGTPRRLVIYDFPATARTSTATTSLHDTARLPLLHANVSPY
jgi:hypothetical protein